MENNKAFSRKKVRIMEDVERPRQTNSYLTNRTEKNRTVNLNLAVEKGPGIRSRITGGRVVLASLVVVFLLVGFIFARGYKDVRYSVSQGGREVMENFGKSFQMAEEMRFDEASGYLKQNVGILSLIGGSSFLNAAGTIFPFIGDVTMTIKDTTNLSLEMIYLMEKIEELKDNGFYYFQEDGKKLVSLLRGIEELSESLVARLQNIKNTSTRLKNLSPELEAFDSVVSERYFASIGDFYKINRFLSNLIDLIDSEESNVIILFQNPSEMRPAGGFSGTYAHLVLGRGQIREINVEDIYMPDFFMEEKYVPPEPLQGITPDWGARDAAWFFDFPTSARVTKEFLEMSSVYSEKGITFDGIIALNINVLSSILDVIGPVFIDPADIDAGEGEKIEINSENVLFELRSEIEASRERKEKQPKRIIGSLTPIVLEELGEMDEKQKEALAEMVAEHIRVSDIMFFVENESIAFFLKEKGFDGSISGLGNSFWGNYLAVVNANVAGGKSDVFVDQNIKTNIHIDTDGSILTDLTISRSHSGDQETDPWWRATNRNYMQIITNPRSSLVSISGQSLPEETGLKKIINNYDNEEYKRHPELTKIEATTLYNSNNGVWSKRFFGRNVFGFWFNVDAGNVRTLNLRYQIPEGITKPRDGREYSFILDRQPGVNSYLELTIFAPIGYIWRESGTSIYTYEARDLPKKFELVLTLEERIR